MVSSPSTASKLCSQSRCRCAPAFPLPGRSTRSITARSGDTSTTRTDDRPSGLLHCWPATSTSGSLTAATAPIHRAPHRSCPRPALWPASASIATANRQLNAALHRIAITHARCHTETRDYLDRNAPKARAPAKRSAASNATSPAASGTSSNRPTPSQKRRPLY
jgi:hypothetical protein